MARRSPPRARVGRGQHFVALDFGTGSIKAAVGRVSGAPLASASAAVPYFTPENGPSTAVEFEPHAVWEIACKVVRRTVRESGVHADAIAGIGVTSQRFGIVFVGHDGAEVYAGPNRDARAVFEGAEIDADYGQAIWRATGHGPAMLLAWAKLLWFQRNHPERFAQIQHVIGIADWLAWRLSGVLAVEAALGVENGIVTVAAGQDASAIAHELGLGAVNVPPVVRSGGTVGTLKSLAAAEVGLTPGIPVVACGPDTQAGLVGLGVAGPNEMGIIAGWSGAVQVVTSAPIFDDTRALWTGRHVADKRWVVEANAGETGGAQQWLVSLLAGRRASDADFERFGRLAARVPPGARGTSAFLGPSFTSTHEIGLRTGGLLFPVPLAFEPPDAAAIARAAIENAAFALRHCADRLELATGRASSVACGGGMAKSRVFRDIVAAVLGRPVAFGATGDATLRGALSLTATALAGGPDTSANTESRGRELSMIEPAASDVAEYGDLYDSWRLRERRMMDLEL